MLSEDDYTTDAKLFAEQWVRYFYPSFQKEFSSLNHEKRTELTSNASVWWQAEHQNPFIQEKMDMVNKTGSITE